MRTKNYAVLQNQFLQSIATGFDVDSANELIKTVRETAKTYMVSNTIYNKLNDPKFSSQFSKAFLDGIYDDYGTILMPQNVSLTYGIEHDGNQWHFVIIVVSSKLIKGAAKGFIKPDGEIAYQEFCKLDMTPIVDFLFTFVLFKKYVEVETVVLKPKQKTKVQRQKYFNESSNDVTIIDSTYFRTIIVEGFSVRGHFRWQRYGKGLEQKKLIWIDEFEKKSYVRKAKKLN
jgi:hypothetical protein